MLEHLGCKKGMNLACLGCCGKALPRDAETKDECLRVFVNGLPLKPSERRPPCACSPIAALQPNMHLPNLAILARLLIESNWICAAEFLQSNLPWTYITFMKWEFPEQMNRNQGRLL